MKPTSRTTWLPSRSRFSGLDLSVTATAPSTAVAGDNVSIPVSWTVTNTSSVDALATWYDEVYLSTTPSGNSGVLDYLGSFQQPGNVPLAAGASYTSNQNVVIPSLAAGNYYLIVSADYSGQAIVNPAQSSIALPISITEPDVDLVVTQATAPLSAVEGNGHSIALSWTVKNQGTDTANNAFWDDAVYLSDKSTLDSTATLLTTQFQSNAALAPGATYTATQTATIPNTATGAKFLLFVTNDGHSQGESNTSNNVFSLPIQLNSPGNVDLTISGTGPASAVIGASIPITWTVNNAGDGRRGWPMVRHGLYLPQSDLRFLGSVSHQSYGPRRFASGGRRQLHAVADGDHLELPSDVVRRRRQSLSAIRHEFGQHAGRIQHGQ